MRLFLNFVLILVFILSCSNSSESRFTFVGENSLIPSYDTIQVKKRIAEQTKKLNAFVKSSKVKYNSEFAFLVDLKISSKCKRFFVINLKTNEIVFRGMMAHGEGSEIEGSDSLQFSNTPNSYMTSLGKYKVGISYNGQFGKAYKLHGLDITNNKAFVRTVVLHRYDCVPEEEQTQAICNSLGCPMLPEKYFLEIEKILDNSNKPILLNLYY